MYCILAITQPEALSGWNNCC